MGKNCGFFNKSIFLIVRFYETHLTKLFKVYFCQQSEFGDSADSSNGYVYLLVKWMMTTFSEVEAYTHV